MPFYELLCIVRTALKEENLKDLVRNTTLDILNSGGVVRGLHNWGERSLPQRMKRHQAWHYEGHYWLMHFDANPTVLAELNRKMILDHRVLRCTTFKLGDKLEYIVQRPDKSKLR